VGFAQKQTRWRRTKPSRDVRDHLPAQGSTQFRMAMDYGTDGFVVAEDVPRGKPRRCRPAPLRTRRRTGCLRPGWRR